jgi:hypothetical protein
LLGEKRKMHAERKNAEQCSALREAAVRIGGDGEAGFFQSSPKGIP